MGLLAAQALEAALIMVRHACPCGVCAAPYNSSAYVHVLVGTVCPMQASVTAARKVFRIMRPLESITPVLMAPGFTGKQPLLIEAINKVSVNSENEHQHLIIVDRRLEMKGALPGP